MAPRDPNDFLTAFGIGAVLGIGAALLLRPEKPNPRKQLQKRLKPHVRKLGKSAARTRKAVRRVAREVRAAGPSPLAAGASADDVILAGRELLAEFRGEVARILDEAREELRGMAQEQARGGPRAAAELDG
jgi:gas vesicle protein